MRSELGEHWWLNASHVENSDLLIIEVPNQAPMGTKHKPFHAALHFSNMKMRRPTQMGSQTKRTLDKIGPDLQFSKMRKGRPFHGPATVLNELKTKTLHNAI